jgi:recombination protein RecT
MSTQTALAKPYDRLKELIGKDEIKQRFSDVLGERANAFMVSILNTVYTNPALRECEPNSVIIESLKAAALDLPIDSNIGFAYLVPFNSREGKKAQLQIGYRGYLQLALRSGQCQAINATRIYEGENIRQDRLTGKVILNGQKTSDKVIGYVAYLKLLNGFEKFVFMTVEEIEAHKVKFAKGYDRADSAWKTSFDAMGLKTVLRQLLTKYGILSITMRDAPAVHDLDPEIGQGRLTEEDDTVEGEFIPADEQPAESQPEPEPANEAPVEQQVMKL